MRTPNNERLSSDIVEAAEAGAGVPGTGPRPAEPERRCILTGMHADRDALIRLALSPPDADGVCHVLPDALAKAPGRGAWIGVSRSELEAAMGGSGSGGGKAGGRLRSALARAFKGAPLSVPADLPARIEQALTRAALERLGLALRAGDLILGTARIADAARGGALLWLGHAGDAQEDGRRKLDQAWRVGREVEGSGERGDVLPLDRAALSVALGRDNVVHLALAATRSAERALVPLQRLLHYTSRVPVDTGPANPAPSDDDGQAG